ncbi:LON peptidase substrate-binding domain-containing protein [Rubrivirga sp.]|uniref:LON peptidase substrate-binding domain-containing protein n=1 Tax=Rubrivirga sp. TaxID=1885344 RepID=UPI003C795CF8
MFDERLPLFPLGVVLLPGEPVPLHIFEPRYKEMVRECIDADVPFGIVYASEEDVAQVGCAARIERVAARYSDGRLDIIAVGESRFSVQEIHRDRSYLTADVAPVEDVSEGTDDGARSAAIARHLKLLEMAGEDPDPQRYDQGLPTSFVIGRNAGLDLADKQKLLEMDLEADRIRWLSTHLEGLLKRLKKARDLRSLARGDGHSTGFPTLGDS